ncbi:hypothetical protein H6G41_19815 [Tolypothrix sp. FACHB-123]|uniref:hypothetical protein n=1 Tax=Tolypothrix sp. FACHB-123 TaxID=2692868 RepID=UPI001682A1E0|nr:hypothetical protein [Tolypothrix sp. FACHB-123]MBD2356846.1 hypothetical protein [Tolypothrix sp. FACHB-123]
MISQDDKLFELVSAIEEISSAPADFWQVTAIIESLGYTDRVLQQEFGFSDALSLGKYVYENHNFSLAAKVTKPQKKIWRNLLKEMQIFIEQFSQSFVFALPLLLILLLESLHIDNQSQLLPPELASLITLATMASLTISGGFVQMISRRGEFYLKLGEPMQARRVCLPIIYLGAATSIIVGLLGLWFGFYQGQFADEYLILAALYYLVLSLLWMLLAALGIQLRWCTPLIMLGLSILFVFLRVWVNLDALTAQIISMFATLLVVVCLVGFRFGKDKKTGQSSGAKVPLPRLSALVYLLAPYFFYGIAYFSFIFGDRMVAGWAVNPASGLVFAINADYQQAMDLALVNFLLLVPLVEYLSYRFMRYWFGNSKNLNVEKLAKFSQKILYRYWLTVGLTVIFFGLCVSSSFLFLKPATWSVQTTLQSLFGCLGYLFFVIGLLNAILLFSLNQAAMVVKSIIPALLVNLTLGYILANVISPDCAVIGLVTAAVLFMLRSTYKVLQAMKQPDYIYYVAGY